MLLGLDLRADSWLSWQYNDAIGTWGEWIDSLIQENQMRDKKGRRMYHHNIKAILGIEEKEDGWDIPDLMDMEVGDVKVKPPSSQTLSDELRDDGSVRIDTRPEGKPKRRYMDPKALLNIDQGSSGNRGTILKEHVRRDTPIVEDVPTTAHTPVFEPVPAPESPPVSKGESAGNRTGRKRGAKRVQGDWDDTVNRPEKIPADWEFDTTPKPEQPEDWGRDDVAPGADPRGHKGGHRYRRGGSFVLSDESDDVTWTE